MNQNKMNQNKKTELNNNRNYRYFTTKKTYFTTKKILIITFISIFFVIMFAVNPFYDSKVFLPRLVYDGIFMFSLFLWITVEYTGFTAFCINKEGKLNVTKFQRNLALIALICAIISEICIFGYKPGIIVAYLIYINVVVASISIGVLDDWVFFEILMAGSK